MHQENACHFFYVFLGLSSIFIGKQKCVPCSDSGYVCFFVFCFSSFKKKKNVVLLPETLLVLNRREATLCVQEQPLIYRHFKNGVIFSDDDTEVALQLLLTGCLRGIKLTLSLKAKQTVCRFALSMP